MGVIPWHSFGAVIKLNMAARCSADEPGPQGDSYV